MTRWLKQSTSVDLPIGPFLDETDGRTAETGLTLTQPDIRLKKNGGNWAQKNAAQTLSHEENGYYEVTLDTTDTNTLGMLRLAVNESGALPVWEDFLVVPANIWDSLFGSDLLDVSVVQWLGTAAAAPTTAGVPAVEVVDMSAAGQTDVRGAVGMASANLDTQIATLATQSLLTTVASYVDTEVAAIKAKTDNLPSDPADQSVLAGAIAALALQVADLPTNSELDTALDGVAATTVTALLDGTAGVEAGLTVRQALRLMAAVLFGKASGMGSTTAIFRDIADTKNRIEATVDEVGNRSSVVRDAT